MYSVSPFLGGLSLHLNHLIVYRFCTGPYAKSWANVFPNAKHLRGYYGVSKVKYHFFDTFMRG